MRKDALVDPDPYTIATVWIAAAALVLQLVQTAHSLVDTLDKKKSARANETRLQRVEDGIEDLEADLRQLTRIIERGLVDSDEFYRSPLRVSVKSIYFDSKSHGELTSKLHECYSKAGALSLWINTLIKGDPQSAAMIGREIESAISEAPERLNEMLASGKDVGSAIRECREILNSCREAITRILDNKDN